MKKWPQEEQDFFEKLLTLGLGYEEIRTRMIEAGFPDRGARAYPSKADRLRQGRPPVAIKDLTGRDQTQKVYTILRDNPTTLRVLCDKLDLPPKEVRRIIDEMIADGYNIIEQDESFVAPVHYGAPKVTLKDVVIADTDFHRVSIAFVSDLHVMSVCAQPTALNSFLYYAVEQHGVEHVFIPGDIFAGVYVYRGQEQDLIPAGRPQNRSLAHLVVDRAVWTADKYIPRIDGVTYWALGGNHDYSMIVNTGLDPVRKLCKLRDDIRYLGYDACSIPLTEKTYLKLIHPTGGPAYAVSYKVQKAIEQQAINALMSAIEREEEPKVSIIMMGHYHLAGWVPDYPIMGGLPGCFEGQTNYLKRKGLYPKIGGTILELGFDRLARPAPVGYHFIPFPEIDDDYKNWPQPEIEELSTKPEDLDIVFELIEPEESE